MPAPSDHPPRPAAPRTARLVAIGLTVAALLLASCGGVATTGQVLTGEATRAQPQREFLPGAVDATNTFGAELFRVLATEPGNLVLAPAAIIEALAMARAGSAGSTRQAFDAVLHADLTPNLDGGLNALSQALAERSGDKRSDTRRGRVDLRLPASVWGQRGTHVKEDLLDLLAADYGTGFRVTAFHADAEGSREVVNNWADEATDGTIKELVPRGEITQYSRFLAAAAANLRAPWQVPFDGQRTRPGAFHRADGQRSDARMMEATSDAFRSARGEGWEAVELPYLGDELALDVIVPTTTLAELEQSMTAARIDEVATALDKSPDEAVAVSLPQFAFTTTHELQDPLTRLGLDVAFTRDADFSGVTSDEVLSLSHVAYQGFIKVDEEGTDPSPDTATAQPTTGTSAGSRRIVVDQPFVFLVRDRPTGSILMIGRVVAPS
jgi:serpin B